MHSALRSSLGVLGAVLSALFAPLPPALTVMRWQLARAPAADEPARERLLSLGVAGAVSMPGFILPIMFM